jgi:hypothetical protein
MPSYVFEVTTEKGTERHPFTLDDDRPLGPQITQVLEELRQRGIVLRGGRDDELAVRWSGRELDLAARPAEQGMSPARPVELRMRERVIVQPVVADRHLPRGVLASLVWGYAGAFAAWLLTGLRTDIGGIVSSYARLDVMTMLVLGGLVGAAVLAGGAVRRRGSVPVAALAGFLLAGAGSALVASGAALLPSVVSLRGFVIARELGWALAGGVSALLLSLYAGVPDARRASESLALGLLTGAVSGIVFALPGPSELWQAVAFLAYGAGVGVAASGPELWHAAAIVEGSGRRRAGRLLALREWPVPRHGAVGVGASRLAWQAGRVSLHPGPSGASVNGQQVAQAIYLTPGALALDGEAYRVRVQGDR